MEIKTKKDTIKLNLIEVDMWEGFPERNGKYQVNFIIVKNIDEIYIEVSEIIKDKVLIRLDGMNNSKKKINKILKCYGFRLK